MINTYRLEYIELIKRAKKRNHHHVRGDGFQKHHILPKSIFPLWKYRKSNIVALTLEEHIEAHRLLKEIFKCKATSDAYNYMIGSSTSKIYRDGALANWQNKEYREKVTNSNRRTWNNPELRQKHSELIKELFRTDPEKSRKRNLGVRKAISQKVRNLETGKVFDSMTEAAIWAGIPKSSPKIGMCCRKERRYAGKTPDGHGASWEYVGESKRLHNNPVVIHDTVLTFTGAKNKKTNVVCWTNGVINVMAEAQPGPDFYRGMTRKSNMPS